MELNKRKCIYRRVLNLDYTLIHNTNFNLNTYVAGNPETYYNQNFCFVATGGILIRPVKPMEVEIIFTLQNISVGQEVEKYEYLFFYLLHEYDATNFEIVAKYDAMEKYVKSVADFVAGVGLSTTTITVEMKSKFLWSGNLFLRQINDRSFDLNLTGNTTKLMSSCSIYTL